MSNLYNKNNDEWDLVFHFPIDLSKMCKDVANGQMVRTALKELIQDDIYDSPIDLEIEYRVDVNTVDALFELFNIINLANEILWTHPDLIQNSNLIRKDVEKYSDIGLTIRIRDHIESDGESYIVSGNKTVH